jgi:hypothetical protein
MKKQIIEVEYVSIIKEDGKTYAKNSLIEFNCYMDAKAFIEGLPEDRVLTEVSQLPVDGTNFTTNKIDNEIMMEGDIG